MQDFQSAPHIPARRLHRSAGAGEESTLITPCPSGMIPARRSTAKAPLGSLGDGRDKTSSICLGKSENTERSPPKDILGGFRMEPAQLCGAESEVWCFLAKAASSGMNFPGVFPATCCSHPLAMVAMGHPASKGASPRGDANLWRRIQSHQLEESRVWTDKRTLPLTWKPGPAPSDFPATKCVTDAVLSLRGGTTSHSKRKARGQFGFLLLLLPLSSFPCFPPTLPTSRGKGQSRGETHWAEFPSDTAGEGPGTL